MKFVNECWAMIPARSGSKTIKNKNIKYLKNKPLIFYSLNFAKNIKLFKKIIFSSDSEQYLKIASKYGKFELHKRKKYAATDKALDFHIFKEYLKDFMKKNNFLPKYFAHLRPTTPLRSKETVLKAVKCFYKNSKSYSSLRTVSLMSETAYKSLRIIKKKLCSISKEDFDLDKYNQPQKNYPKTYVANGIIDIYLTSNILKGYLLGKKVYPFLVEDVNSDIDNLHDFNRIKYYMDKKIK